MEKPGKKLKKLFIIIGTTGAVYAGLKYLLPLVAPFFAGYVAALLLRPAARFLSYRLRVTIKHRTHHLPVGITGGTILLAVMTLLSILLYRGTARLLQEGEMFMVRLPLWIKEFDRWLTSGCGWLERLLGLRQDTVAGLAGEMLLELADTVKTAAMPFLMVNSMTIMGVAAKAAIMCMVTFLAAVLSLQEMEELRDRRDQSMFRREFRVIGARLMQTGKAWLKSQGIIWLAVTGLCVGGLFLMKNPYYIMAGIGIGFLDALPIFGTGTVFIPWIVLELFGRKWKRALFLAGLYLVCYLTREMLEAHVMGGRIGLSPLETLASVYVGLELFGFFGFILGPLGLLLIEDLVDSWTYL